MRKIVGEMSLLVPGGGAQGGDIQKTVEAGQNSKGLGLIIHAARSIIFASSGEDFAQKAREKTQELKDEVNKYRKS